MENTGLASALPIQIGASIGFGLAQDWLIGPNWHALATPQRGMPIHVNPVQSANPRPIQNTAETVRPPDWHGLADWIFKKGEYFTPQVHSPRGSLSKGESPPPPPPSYRTLPLQQKELN